MAAKGRRAVSPKGRTEAERRPREERCCPMFLGTYGTLTQKWPGRACPNRSPAFFGGHGDSTCPDRTAMPLNMSQGDALLSGHRKGFHAREKPSPRAPVTPLDLHPLLERTCAPKIPWTGPSLQRMALGRYRFTCGQGMWGHWGEHLLATQRWPETSGMLSPPVHITSRRDQCWRGHSYTSTPAQGFLRRLPPPRSEEAMSTMFRQCWGPGPHPSLAWPIQPSPTPPAPCSPRVGGRTHC